MESNSPAFEAGLRAGDLITHINSEAVQGLLHIQVVSLILSGGKQVSVRAVPLENTSIQVGGRKRPANGGKMMRRSQKKKHQRGKSEEKKRRTSLLKRLSSKRAEQHLGSPLTPSRSFTCLNRSLSSGDSLPASPTRSKSPKSPPSNRVWSPASDSAHSTANSSQSSSPSSSTPNSPANSAHFSRPSSLHGLKHKLQCIKSPHRRKSVHNIPLSPLARTPSPSPMASSPTRSPSPLTMVHGQAVHHQPGAHHHPTSTHHTHTPGISNMTQTYNPSAQSSPSPIQNLTPTSRRSRPKSCEPSSPLLRRALSPDRLHPNSAEKHHRKTSSWHDKNVDYKDGIDKKSDIKRSDRQLTKSEKRRSWRLEDRHDFIAEARRDLQRQDSKEFKKRHDGKGAFKIHSKAHECLKEDKKGEELCYEPKIIECKNVDTHKLTEKWEEMTVEKRESKDDKKSDAQNEECKPDVKSDVTEVKKEESKGVVASKEDKKPESKKDDKTSELKKDDKKSESKKEEKKSESKKEEKKSESKKEDKKSDTEKPEKRWLFGKKDEKKADLKKEEKKADFKKEDKKSDSKKDKK